MILATAAPSSSRLGLECCPCQCRCARGHSPLKRQGLSCGRWPRRSCSATGSPIAAGDGRTPGRRVGRASRRLLHDAAHLRRHRRRPPRAPRAAPGRIAAAGRGRLPLDPGACARRWSTPCARPATPESRLRVTFAPPRLFVSVEPFTPPDPAQAADRGRLHDDARAARAAGGQGHPLPGHRPRRLRGDAGDDPRGPDGRRRRRDPRRACRATSSRSGTGGCTPRTTRALAGVTRSMVLELAEGRRAPRRGRRPRGRGAPSSRRPSSPASPGRCCPSCASTGRRSASGRPGPVTGRADPRASGTRSRGRPNGCSSGLHLRPLAVAFPDAGHERELDPLAGAGGRAARRCSRRSGNRARRSSGGCRTAAGPRGCAPSGR